MNNKGAYDYQDENGMLNNKIPPGNQGGGNYYQQNFNQPPNSYPHGQVGYGQSGYGQGSNVQGLQGHYVIEKPTAPPFGGFDSFTSLPGVQ